MHRDLKVANIFVTQAHNLEVARLAVGDFGAAQEGDLTVSFEQEHTGARVCVLPCRAMPCHATVGTLTCGSFLRLLT